MLQSLHRYKRINIKQDYGFNRTMTTKLYILSELIKKVEAGSITVCFFV